MEYRPYILSQNPDGKNTLLIDTSRIEAVVNEGSRLVLYLKSGATIGLNGATDEVMTTIKREWDNANLVTTGQAAWATEKNGK